MSDDNLPAPDAYMPSARHAVHCALYDPTPSSCDCGRRGAPLWGAAKMRAALAAQPVGSAEERIRRALFERAKGHPAVLEIMADCADAIDAENSAQHDSDVDGPYDGSRWMNAAADLRKRAAAIRAEDPDLWPTAAPIREQTAGPAIIAAAVAAERALWVTAARLAVDATPEQLPMALDALRDVLRAAPATEPAQQTADARDAALPKEPPPGLLMSMAIRYDHGLGVPGYYDNLIMGRAPEPWETHAARLASALSLMRKLYEEVSGHGFYRPEREAEYAKLAAIDAARSKP